ncbi:MAG: radical SAM protein [Candidatus Bathyarchaeia archaeon]
MFEVKLNAPLDVEWEITNSCNLRCRHCYVAAAEKLERELDTNEALKLIGELDKIGVTDITISGGEPFLRRDLWQIIEEIKSRRIPFIIYTNATLLNEGKIKKLADSNIKAISVSLNGATAKAHNFVQNADTFKKVLNTIRKLNDYGVKVQVLFTLMKVNANEFDELISLSRRLNVESICIYPFYPQGRGRENLDHLALDAKSTMGLLKKAVEFASPPPHIYVGGCLSQRFTPRQKHSLIRGNPCGKLTAIITPDGHLRPCNFLPYRTRYTIREKSIYELWNEPIFKEVRDWRKKMVQKLNCQKCELLPLCMGVCLSMHSIMKNKKKGEPLPS